MTNEELLQKMEEDMKLRNFSKYSFYTYSHKAEPRPTEKGGAK